MDSCADILRANAAQAGVDPKFEVLDETEAAILLDEIVGDVLAAIKAPVSKLFARYDAFKIEAALKQMSLVNGSYPPLDGDAEAHFAIWLQRWQEGVFAERQRLLGSSEAHDLQSIEYLPAADKLSELVVQYEDYLRRMEIDDAMGSQIYALMQRCHQEGAVGNKGSVKAWGSKEQKNEVAQLLRDLRRRIKDALDAIGDMPGELDRLTAKLLPLWHQLLDDVRAAYRERKNAAAQLDFDDLERLAADLLHDQGVRDRYRNAEFKHLLVDEFQDTNAAQWRIIRSLADLENGGSLFTVGDPKQSIYQFRGADVSVFNVVRNQFRDHSAANVLPLSTSFRSHRVLVEQFNMLFEHILSRDESSRVADYEVEFDEPMAAFRVDSLSPPAIELQLLDRLRS